MFSTIVYAQEVVQQMPDLAPVVQEVSMFDFLTLLFQSLNGLKGASALGAAGILVQLVLAFSKTSMAGMVFKKLSGGMKLVVVTGLTVVAGVVSLMLAGITLPAALVHSSTLAAFSVFGHQAYKEFFEKKKDAA